MTALPMLVATELRLFLRDRATVLLSLALPTLLLLLLGAIPALREQLTSWTGSVSSTTSYRRCWR